MEHRSGNAFIAITLDSVEVYIYFFFVDSRAENLLRGILELMSFIDNDKCAGLKKSAVDL
jgi:hypothetical protein